jgi:poly-gamma-glutamate capsule biosynthesis protein CapA/YwtB (metallophosphatase superfamily)
MAVLVVTAGAAAAQVPTPTPTPTPAPAPDRDARVLAPRAVAAGGRLVIRVRGAALPARLELRTERGWKRRGTIRSRRAAVRLRAPDEPGRLRLRVRGADLGLSRERRVRVRYLKLSAVGDINFGNGPGLAIDAYGPAYPWTSVGPVLRRADIAFGNLECAVSRRGSPQPKQFTFRGGPRSLKAMRRESGMDVVNLANNHAGDFGDVALLDTLRYARREGIVPVGAGRDAARAYRPRVVRRLGLRVAFVGFSAILPFDFRATAASPGTAWAYPGRIRRSVRQARRRADVVVATFHWGIERSFREDASQRAMAGMALDAGATAVIGAHPHVLQPIRRTRRRLVAYSLGNFVFSAASPGTQRTGILQVRLARRRVASARLRRATIVASRPVLDRPAAPSLRAFEGPVGPQARPGLAEVGG